MQINLKKKLDHSYKITIKENIESDLVAFLKANYKNAKICIVSDAKVSKLYGSDLLKLLKKSGFESTLLSFPAGEKNKHLSNIEKLSEKMIQTGFNRKDLIIALGGGVTGDMAGFIAAIFMRGISFIQVPTSLLAMVDSSIGGKTGVDLKSGKNLIGAFHQPKAVFIGTDYLSSLNKREFNNGMAEIIKHAIIKDAKYFKWIESRQTKIQQLNSSVMKELIKKSCQIKAAVVEKDEKEKNLRMILNYGHTIGHALEQLSDYKLKHGEAISIGMVKENQLNPQFKSSDKDRIIQLLKAFKLPTDHPLCKKSKELLKLMQNDKKKSGKLPPFIVPQNIGKVTINQYNEKEILKALQ